MNNQAAYYRDSYLAELETTISGISGNTLVFADTIFYPEGGGQPGDQGQLETTNKTVSIIDTKRNKESGEIHHEVDDNAGFQIGPIEISKIENKGKKNRRVHIKFKTD